MALHLYYGGAGSGKSHRVFTEIIERSMRETGTRFLILVPEQSTMETQRQIVRLHPRHGILNIDVLSMTRLAYRVFAEVGYRRESMLEEIGKTFLLKKVALDRRDDLPWYGQMLSRPEFLAQMKAQISELMLYGVEAEELERLAGGRGEREGIPEHSALARKLRDISLLYREFRKRLEGTYMTAEEVPERLSLLAERSALLKNAVLVLDGFTGFTPLQLVLLQRLMPLAQDIYVTVTADEERDLFGPFRESDLFAMGYEMAQQLRRIARNTATEVAESVPVHGGAHSRHGASPELRDLERRLFRRPDGKSSGDSPDREATEAPLQHQIRLRAVPNPREEIAEVSREICRLVREEGLRYREIAVVTGDLGTYGNYVREQFPEDGIPFFVDEKRALIRNPFMEYLRAALEAVTENYSYSGMFRMLKCGMTDFDGRAVDVLENYVIALGIRGKKQWRESFLRHYRGEDEGEVPALNALRSEICALLDPLADEMARRGGTVRDKTTALYEFCLRSRAEERLRERELQYTALGRGDLAREYAQVWPYIVSFLDKLVSILGDEPISMRDYRALIEAGFSEARVAIIPPGNDQVLVGDMERSRLAGIRVLFFVGVNEGLIPKPPAGGGALTEAERAALEACSLHLKPASRRQMYIDRFYLYLTLTKPSERLYLSWPLGTSSGEVARPAYLIGVIRRLLPSVPLEEEGTAMPSGDEAARDMCPERERSGIRLLVQGLAELEAVRPSPAYLELFAHYLHHPIYRARCLHLLEAAGTRKQADRISRAAAGALYGRVLRNSASRLELFASCRFAHFLSYGLRLKPRQEYSFTGLEMGSLLHRSLELFELRTRRDHISWASLAEDPVTRNRYAASCVREAVEEYGSGIFTEHARDRYQIERMERLMAETAWTQAEQLAAGEFAPLSAEADFREMEYLDLIRVDMQGTEGEPARMELVGKIDRVDLSEDGDVTYVKIIDYKTGHVTFDLTEIYYGLQLQLVVYLNAAMEMLRQQGRYPVPAGMFYYQIQDPLVDYLEEETDRELARRRLKAMVASGVVLRDAAALRHFDRKLLPGAASEVVPVALKKDGDFTARSSVLTEEEFRIIGSYVKRSVRKTAEEMLQGHAEINPYEYRQGTACDYCLYRGVCGFDRRIPGYSYRRLEAMKAGEVLSRMEDGSRREEDSPEAGSHESKTEG